MMNSHHTDEFFHHDNEFLDCSNESDININPHNNVEFLSQS